MAAEHADHAHPGVIFVWPQNTRTTPIRVFRVLRGSRAFVIFVWPQNTRTTPIRVFRVLRGSRAFVIFVWPRNTRTTPIRVFRVLRGSRASATAAALRDLCEIAVGRDD